jgi:RNA polymerase sigma-70 factor (ECF subfamily)
MGEPRGDTVQLQALLSLAAQGDGQSLDQAIALAAERLEKLTHKMLRRYPHLQRWEQTDDVLQTAVMRLHRSLRKVRPDSVRSFLGLATVEIRRTLIDLLRHHFGPHGAAAHHHTDFLDSVRDADQGVLTSVPDHDDAAESLEAWTSFHEAMDALPEDEREVMHLGWYGGMRQAEMADVLGISVSTIKRRWYRARLHLRAAMAGRSPPGAEC